MNGCFSFSNSAWTTVATAMTGCVSFGNCVWTVASTFIACVDFTNAIFTQDTTFNMVGITGESIYNLLGANVTFINMVSPTAMIHVSGDLTVIIAPSCFLGMADVHGNVHLVDLHTGLCVVNDYTNSGATNTINTAVQSSLRPKVSLYMDWTDGVDPTILTLTDPATGAPWAIAPNAGVLTEVAAPNASENARLVTVNRFITCLGSGSGKILRKLIVEFEQTFTNGGNVDETLFFVGMSPNNTDDKSQPNIVGFGVAAGLMTAYSSNGANTQETPTAFNCNAFAKFRIEMYGGPAGAPLVDFYINEILVAHHDGSAAPFAVPSGVMFFNDFFPTTAGGAETIQVGGLRIWHEDFKR
jgi:hypothetical protein